MSAVLQSSTLLTIYFVVRVKGYSRLAGEIGNKMVAFCVFEVTEERVLEKK